MSDTHQDHDVKIGDEVLIKGKVTNRLTTTDIGATPEVYYLVRIPNKNNTSFWINTDNIHDVIIPPLPEEPPVGSVVLVNGTAWQRIYKEYCRWQQVGYSTLRTWRELFELGEMKIIYRAEDKDS